MSINTHFHEAFVQVDSHHWDVLIPLPQSLARKWCEAWLGVSSV